MDSNYSCQHCGAKASHFEYRNSHKIPLCKDHLVKDGEALPDIFKISAINFITSDQDIELYRNWAKRVKLWKGNVESLKGTVTLSTEEATKKLDLQKEAAIATLITAYENVKLQVRNRGEKFTEQIKTEENRLEELFPNPEGESSLRCDLITRDISEIEPLLRVQVGDVSTALPTLVNRNCSMNSLGFILSTFEERIHIPQVPNPDQDHMHQEETKEHANLVLGIAAKVRKTGLSLLENKDFGLAIPHLQTVLTMLTNSSLTTGEVAQTLLELGITYIQKLCMYKEAETAFLKSYEILQLIRANPEDIINCLNWLSLSELKLKKYSIVSDTLKQVFEVLKLCIRSSELEQLALCVSGMLALETKQYPEAELTLLRGLEIGNTQFPTSETTAVALASLGRVYGRQRNYEDALQKHREALEILHTYYPTSENTALFLKNMGFFLSKINRNLEATQHFEESILIYRNYYPKTEEYADTLVCYGILQQNMEQLSQAVQSYSAALEIYEEKCSVSEQRAMTYYNLGMLYSERHEEELSRQYLRSALSIYFAYYPDSEHINSILVKLASSYTKKKCSTF